MRIEMNDLEHKIVELIQQGEGLTLEFKECRNTLNRDVYETVCAFLNRHGGTLLLGIKDNGDILGVDQDRVDQIKKDFVTTINNSQKINPACYLSVNEATLQNKTVLSVYIPESSQVHRCNGRIYDRNEDGDFDIWVGIICGTLLMANRLGVSHQSMTISRIFSLLQEVINECTIPYLSFERPKRAC